MNVKKLAILGGGNMGRAIIGGLVRRGMSAKDISVGEAFEAARAALVREFAVAVHPDNAQAVADADLVVVAVKPQDAGAALSPLRPLLIERRPIILSVAAGIRVSSLEAWCGTGVPVVRAMPNRPALVGAGATGLYAPQSVEAEHRAGAEQILQAVGETVWVPSEDALDVVTALSGSGPAYFFLLAELMAHAAVANGLAPEAARRLAVATLHGAGLLAHSSDGDLARLRAEVTSKGGTTEAALRAFESADLNSIVSRAIEAATQRGRELAAKFGNEA